MPPLQKHKPQLHPRNKHKGRYDFKQLVISSPELGKFIKLNAYKDKSIDFADPSAVMALNMALLKHHYGISHWDIPKGYLCPPIPGRADYVHHIADLLSSSRNGRVPNGDRVVCLDIGVGANCVYPIIGNKEYGWSFVGSDIDPVAIKSANTIVNANASLSNNIELRLQSNPNDIFNGIILKEERIDLTICNPPFHSSQAEAQSGTQRKLNNLNNRKNVKLKLNFGGQNNELWCDGGEKEFVKRMIRQSKQFANSCFWFSTLISKSANLDDIYSALRKAQALEVNTIPMGQGNKISRIVAWTFLTKEQQKKWVDTRWR